LEQIGSILIFLCFEFFKRALQVFPGCPAAVRLGIGLCRYKLGQLDKARQAFDRVLQASGTGMFISSSYHIADCMRQQIVLITIFLFCS